MNRKGGALRDDEAHILLQTLDSVLEAGLLSAQVLLLCRQLRRFMLGRSYFLTQSLDSARRLHTCTSVSLKHRPQGSGNCIVCVSLKLCLKLLHNVMNTCQFAMDCGMRIAGAYAVCMWACFAQQCQYAVAFNC